MKKLILAVMFGVVGNSFALENASIGQMSQDDSSHGASYTGLLSNEDALAYNKQFAYDMSEKGLNRFSATIHYGSASLTASSFTSGNTSSATITVISTGTLRATVIRVNGYQFRFGPSTDMNVSTQTPVGIGASVTEAAHNLYTAIIANTALVAITTGTHTLGVIDLVSQGADATNYEVYTTSPTICSVGGNFGGGAVSKVVLSTDKITIASHGYGTGTPVVLSGTQFVGGLGAGTYYVYKYDANTIGLSSTSALAQAGTVINLTTMTATATQRTTTVTPSSLAGVPSFKWQFSNDNSNWFDVVTTSVTVSAYTYPYATVAYDFDIFNYRYVRLNAISPTAGGMYLKTYLYGKKL